MKPLILPMGEPAGIGAEITAGAWRALRGSGPCFALIDDATRDFGVPLARPVLDRSSLYSRFFLPFSSSDMILSFQCPYVHDYCTDSASSAQKNARRARL